MVFKCGLILEVMKVMEYDLIMGVIGLNEQVQKVL